MKTTYEKLFIENIIIYKFYRNHSSSIKDMRYFPKMNNLKEY